MLSTNSEKVLEISRKLCFLLRWYYGFYSKWSPVSSLWKQTGSDFWSQCQEQFYSYWDWILLSCRLWDSPKWSYFPLWIDCKKAQIRVCATHTHFVYSPYSQFHLTSLAFLSFYSLKLFYLIELCVSYCLLNEL